MTRQDPVLPGRLRLPRQDRATAPQVPVTDVRPGATIGGWTVVAGNLTRRDGIAVRVTCTECGRPRETLRRVVAEGAIWPCRHGKGRRAQARRATLDQVYAWVTENAAGRLFGVSEITAAFGVSPAASHGYLRELIADGRIARLRQGAYALPGVGLPADQVPWTARIIAFLAADGGGTAGEIVHATGIDFANLSGYLTALLRNGRVTRVGASHRGFYLLPGQEPGQIISLSAPPGPPLEHDQGQEQHRQQQPAGHPARRAARVKQYV